MDSRQALSDLPHDVWREIALLLMADAESIRLLEIRKALLELNDTVRVTAMSSDFHEAEAHLKGRSGFAASCRLFHGFSKHDDRVFNTLMQHVENGNLVQVKKLFDGKPKDYVVALLSRQGKAATYPDKLLTPIELAFLQCDVPICGHFKTLPGAAELIGAQLNPGTIGQAVVPNNFFDEIMAAIMKPQIYDVALEDKIKFRNKLRSLIKDKFDLILLFSNAIDFFDQLFYLANPYRQVLFGMIVLGSLQFESPPWLRRAFAQGIPNILNKFEPLQDGFKLREKCGVEVRKEVVEEVEISASPFLEKDKLLGIDWCIDTEGKAVGIQFSREPLFKRNLLRTFFGNTIGQLSQLCPEKTPAPNLSNK